MKFQKGDKVIIDLGSKFDNSLAEAIIGDTIDVFEDGSEILISVKPINIVQDRCGYAHLALNMNLGIQTEQIKEYVNIPEVHTIELVIDGESYAATDISGESTHDCLVAFLKEILSKEE